MQRDNLLTRDQAIALVGEAVVLSAEQESCEITSRLMQDRSIVEFAASKLCRDHDYYHAVTVYYYQDADIVKECDDLGTLTWTIAGYEVV
jgi:hypothetical protein